MERIERLEKLKCRRAFYDVGGSIGGVALMVHFFGVIGIIAVPIGMLLAGENR